MISIIQFPGTNCEYDTKRAYDKLNEPTQIVWHKEVSLPKKTKLVVIPGGFSYGDYLRSGAIAKVSNILVAINEFSKKGGKVLGICNGFQVLTEAHLLKGSLVKNENLHFISKFQKIKVQNNDNSFLKSLKKADILDIPIAHGDGNYQCSDDELKSMQDNNQILFTYCDENGKNDNPNGSIKNIAGICNKNKNVFALMPHPERAVEDILGNSSGLEILKNLID